MSQKGVLKIVLALIVISFLLIQLSLAQTTERVGCCARTTNGNTCQDYTYESDCNAGQFYNGVCANVPDCKLLTCATPDGCLFNYPKLSCEANGGSISLLAMPAICEQGCCGIANRGYGVMTKKECQDKTTTDLGYELSKMDFIGGLTSEKECDLRFAGSDRGCCYNGAATCSFGTREECLSGNGIFRQGIYCSQIVECEAEANKSQGCGVLDGDKNKLCNFDSQGNQEDCYYTCSTNEQMCKISFGNNGKAVPSCVSTSCTIAAGFYQQQMTEGSGDDPILENVAFTGTILNGHSRCYNFFTSDDKENPIVEVAFGKSTGLQNNKIVCMYGDFVSQGLGTDRNTLCVDGQSTSHAYTQTNKWQTCSDCGKGSSVGDFIGEFFAAGLTSMDLSSLFTLKSDETTGYLSFGTLLKKLGKQCTESDCESSGFCVYHAEISKGAAAGGTTGSWGAAGLNTHDIGASCSPKYTPGTDTSCGLCGDGGDGTFNMCEEKECLRLGNCEFESNSVLEKVGIGALYGFMLATSAKFNVIPEYVMIDCLFNPTCIVKGIGDELSDFIISPIKGIIETATKAEGVWKYLFQPMWDSLSSKVTDLIPVNKIFGGK